jgi:hypothetical protein
VPAKKSLGVAALGMLFAHPDAPFVEQLEFHCWSSLGFARSIGVHLQTETGPILGLR